MYTPKFKIGDVIKYNNLFEFNIEITNFELENYKYKVTKDDYSFVNIGKTGIADFRTIDKWYTIFKSASQIPAQVHEQSCTCDNFTLFNRGCKCGAFQTSLKKDKLNAS